SEWHPEAPSVVLNCDVPATHEDLLAHGARPIPRTDVARMGHVRHGGRSVGESFPADAGDPSAVAPAVPLYVKFDRCRNEDRFDPDGAISCSETGYAVARPARSRYRKCAAARGSEYTQRDETRAP